MTLSPEPRRKLLTWITGVLLAGVTTWAAAAPEEHATSLSAGLEQSSDPSKNANVETFEAAWRILRDSYLDPTFHGLDWDAVRVELLPKAKAAEDRTQLRAVVQELLDRLGGSHMALIPGDVAQAMPNLRADKSGGTEDPSDSEKRPPSNHANVSGPAKGATDSDHSGARDGDVGLEIRWKEGVALITRVDRDGPSARAGIKAGWILESIDGDRVEGWVKGLPLTLRPAQKEFMAWNLIMGKIHGRPGSSILLSLRNAANDAVSIPLERRRLAGEPAKLGFLPTLYAHLESENLPIPGNGQVGLIRFNLWMIPIVRPLDEKIDKFRRANGIILDLRGNLGGIGGMILGVSGHFLKDRISLGTLQMRGNELQFFANPRRVSTAGGRVEPYDGPLAIIVDGLSLSAAEIFAGGMQALGRARIFGEPSGGQALPAVWDRLPNGDVLYHAFGDFVTASGTRLEGRGVTPDERVPVTRADLLAGRDAPVQAALRWIATDKKTAHDGKLPLTQSSQDAP